MEEEDLGMMKKKCSLGDRKKVPSMHMAGEPDPQVEEEYYYYYYYHHLFIIVINILIGIITPSQVENQGRRRSREANQGKMTMLLLLLL